MARETSQMARRLRSAAAFLAVVWGVAASFVAFELLAVRGMDMLLGHPTLGGDVVLSRATLDSRTCDVDAGEAVTAAAAPEAAAGAWLLGLKVGRDALARQYGSVDPAVLARMHEDAERLAEVLGIPVPASFTPERLANANTEFVGFVERDAAATARQLALRQSPAACRLFKLATFWGYAELARPALAGERTPFAPEIRYYALAAGLPDVLWAPMTAPTTSDATPDQIARDTTALTTAVGAYLARAALGSSATSPIGP